MPLSTFHIRQTAALVVIVIGFLTVPCVGTMTLDYSVSDLGTLGGTTSSAAAINDSGVVVGESQLAGDTATHAFEYSNGVMTDLGTLGGTNSGAAAINNAGVIVGSSLTGHGSYVHAFSYGWPSTNAIGDLGYFGNDSDPGADFNSNAFGISDNGTIVATSSYITQFSSGTYGGVTVGGPNEGPWGFNVLKYAPTAISHNGTILGSNWGGPGIPIDINDSGQIVGKSSGIAFLYTPHLSTVAMLGTLGGSSSDAEAINDAGQVVGESDTVGGNTDAFLYDSSFGMIDLNNAIPSNSGWELQSATGINAVGQIVGDGVIDGQDHAFLLTPSVPEPSVLLPLVLSWMGVLGRRRR